jgi:hypothetical protein
MTTAPQKSTSGTPATTSGTPQGTGTGTSVNFDSILAQLAKSGGVGNAQEGPTRADANAVVQSVYQQLLGRSAVGTELNQAIGQFMANDGGTGGKGNIENFVMGTNEFQAKSENKYLDAIYNQLARDVRGAQA